MTDLPLVDRLSSGVHKITIEPKIQDKKTLLERVDSGFIFVLFEDTIGKTELGIELDEIPQERPLGSLVKLSGTCFLDFHKIRCTIQVDLSTQKGEGLVNILTSK